MSAAIDIIYPDGRTETQPIKGDVMAAADAMWQNTVLAGHRVFDQLVIREEHRGMDKQQWAAVKLARRARKITLSPQKGDNCDTTARTVQAFLAILADAFGPGQPLPTATQRERVALIRWLGTRQ